MKHIETEILVIGGGATGTGVVRDAALRGFKAVLVDKSDLTQGTTGRYHGLLHSGGRYAVKDPQAAEECIRENTILRRIMPFCIEDTGGFFVITPWDDPAYADQFVEGCKKSGIPVEELSVSQMLREEPLLNPQISRCFRVPDGSADSWLGADANAEDARQRGSLVLPYHKVLNLIKEGDRVRGARCLDLVKDEEITITADMVVNAAGAWAGQITAPIGIEVQIVPGKGTMVAVNHRILHTVVNRCHKSSDGDIIVPTHTVAVIGTTDVPVADPDHYGIEPWEVRLMLEEGDKLVPGFKNMRMVRAWAGVRPLYKETNVTANREISRAFVLLDHAERDGVEGLITITSGKWTTYRKMAEVTMDLVCTKLGTQRPCTTHLEVLPEPKYARKHAAAGRQPAREDEGGIGYKPPVDASEPYATIVALGDKREKMVSRFSEPGSRSVSQEGHDTHSYHTLGQRLANVEHNYAYGNLVCECELATVDDIIHALQEGTARTLDDVRRDTRLGMGPCQGGFCTFRAAGLLQKLRQPPVEETNVALRDFLQERWKGLRPILWGQQLRQERLDELIYLSVLNADHLPGPKSSKLSPILYLDPGQDRREIPGNGDQAGRESSHAGLARPEPAAPSAHPALDVLVVGAGLAGLTAAWQLAQSGKKTRVIAKGWGANFWHTGCVDVLGYYPIDSGEPVESPAAALERLIQEDSGHPYAIAGMERISAAIEAFKAMCAAQGYPMHGSLEQNWLLPTAAGGMRPTCLAPETMIAGDLRKKDPILVVGFERYGDLYPDWVAANLTAQGIPARAVTLSLPVVEAQAFANCRTLAALFEQPHFRAEFAAALKPHLGDAARVGLPAVLGLVKPLEVLHDLQDRLGVPLFEIPTLPASIPGIRLTNLLVQALEAAGGRVFDGMEAVDCEADGNEVTGILTESAARLKRNRARNFLLATGGILGGGIQTHYTGRAWEKIFHIPVEAPGDQVDWLDRDFLTPRGHPIFRSGIAINASFQPVGANGEVLFENLYAAGTTLARGEFIRERSFDGVAIVTGYTAAQQLI